MNAIFVLTHVTLGPNDTFYINPQTVFADIDVKNREHLYTFSKSPPHNNYFKLFFQFIVWV